MQENEKSDPCSPPAMWVSLVWLEKCWSQTRLKAQPWLEATETGKCGVICPSRLENFQSTHASDVHILLLVRAITLHPRALVLNHSVVLQEQMSWIIANIFIIYLLSGCRKCFLIVCFPCLITLTVEREMYFEECMLSSALNCTWGHYQNGVY